MKTTAILLGFLFTPPLFARFTNYNSILIGERASGMGGAYTALTGDPSACGFYNPATLARMSGSTLSAAVNLYNKYDTQFGDQQDYQSAALRVNQGKFQPIPSSGGSVHTFRNFAFGISIVFPDFNGYVGEINSADDDITSLNFRDESLWVGGALALNLTEQDAIGFTAYYTSRSFSRSITDRFSSGADLVVVNEEKLFTQNALLYQFGYYRSLRPNWSFGINFRFPSLPVSGTGSFYRSEVSTASAEPLVNERGIKVLGRLPFKLNLGLAYDRPKSETWSLDVSFYDDEKFDDFQDGPAADTVDYRKTYNLSLGHEKYIKRWLAWRVGAFTNFSSRPDVPRNPTSRHEDHIDMWGWSSNFAIHTSPNSRITLGGYYSGGSGHSGEVIQQEFVRVKKSIQIFSFLVSTTFNF